MFKVGRKLNRLLATVLSVLLVISMLPTAMLASAATGEGVTITVVDDVTKEPIVGAKVSFVIFDNDLGYEVMGDDDVITGENGMIDLEGVQPGNIKISSVKVTHDDYELYENNAFDQAVTSNQQNFTIEMTCVAIKDVEIVGKTLEYNGAPQEAVSVTEVQGDTVTYKLDGAVVPAGQKVQVTDVKRDGDTVASYAVEVTVVREGYNPLVKTVYTTVNPRALEGIELKPLNVEYSEQNGVPVAQTLVELLGTQQGDVLSWTVDGTEYVSDDLPASAVVGNHTVKVSVDRGPNYEKYNSDEVTVTMRAGTLSLDGLTITGLSHVYDGAEKESVTVSGEGNYTLWYQLSEAYPDGTNHETEVNPDDSKWKNTPDKVTNAGSYIMWVKATKANYNDESVDVVPAAGAVIPFNVYVAKKPQNISFKNYAAGDTSAADAEEAAPFADTAYDFAIEEDSALVGTVSYSVNVAEDVAKISADGMLTVYQPGPITVIAKLSGDDNHAACEIMHTLTVTAKAEKGKYVGFAQEKVDYVLGTNDGVASALTAAKTQDYDDGTISYSIPAEYGLAVDNNGKVTVADYAKLIGKMNGNALDVTVTATKAAEQLGGNAIYPEDTATYILHITFAQTPAVPYTIEGDANDDGWYKTAITVTPADKHTVATSVNDDATTFAATVSFSNQGAADRIIYLRNTDNGGITAPVVVKAKIDTVKPEVGNMRIEVQELSVIEKLGQKFGFFKSDVTVKFYVADENGEDESGIKTVNWSYMKDTYAPDSITADMSGKINAVYNETTENFEATLTLPLPNEDSQLRGTFAFTATDVAGNSSNEKRDDGTIIVRDTISPELSVAYEIVDSDLGDGLSPTYQSVTDNGVCRHYYSDSVRVSLIFKENNLFTDDVVTTVNGVAVTPAWTSDGNVHVGTFSLEDEGDHTVQISYVDDSGNEMEMSAETDNNGAIAENTYTYTSEVITIDKVDPVIDFSFDGIWDDTETADNAEQKATITITDQNFRASDVIVDVAAKDIKNNDVVCEDIQAYAQDENNWTHNGSTHTLELKSGEADQAILVEAIYNMTVNYKDLAGRNADEVASGEFVVDHTAPAMQDIQISKPNFVDKTLETLTLGFYQPDVTVTLTATDAVSGVKSFYWNYTRQEDAGDFKKPQTNVSASNLESYLNGNEDLYREIVNSDGNAVIEQDGDTFTAEFKLPEKEAQQLRGALKAYADDRCYNHKDAVTTVTDGTDELDVIVIDGIAPNVQVEFSKASRYVYKQPESESPVVTDAYYGIGNSDIKGTITVQEINFYQEDVQASYIKNGDTENPIELDVEWSEAVAEDGKKAPADTYIGEFVLSGDGHYQVNVSYTDRSGNFHEDTSAYTSHNLTIDTARPVVKVEYQNKKVINKLTDTEEKERSYLDNMQTAQITLTEHNFASDEVAFNLIAKDVTGQEIDVKDVCHIGKWTEDETGDIHYITIAYSGEANYTFDVEYKDLATNEILDYAPDYFTVDKSVPENLSVEYSTSVLETVLEAISFGFYNAKMTVTLSAEDSIAGVHSFNYSYINAKNVSTVNAQLLDQAIKAAAITYSEDALLATTTFEIPRKVLGNNNQFNGTVEFTATDRSGNVTDIDKDAKRIVVDNIAPTATIEYNDPVNTVGNISYYAGDINATLTITEANFYAGDVQVMISKNGEAPFAVTPAWVDKSVDVHIGTFTLTENGHYIITVNYADKSSNKMETYVSDQMTIDTVIEAPTFRINGTTQKGNGGAYKEVVKVEYTYQDENFADKTIELYCARFDKNEKVNDKYIKVADGAKGGSGSFTIPEEVLNDGIYNLKITMRDKAGHHTESSVSFIVNRFGSVYQYNDALIQLMEDVYTQKVDHELVITEYNADKLANGSLKLIITRDGDIVESNFASEPAEYHQADASANGWYEYRYAIDPKYFAEDGVYKISLVSAYATDDTKENNNSTSVPENSFTEKGEPVKGAISFTVDDTAPEIRNIVGLEKAIADIDKIDGKYNVTYTIVDVGGLKSIEIFVNGASVKKITEFGEDLFSFSGDFDIMESNDLKAQTVKIEVVDLAGNVISTDDEEFRNAHASKGDPFIFSEHITVSRNHFVRWYANKPLFFGSIGGVIILAAAIWFFVAAKNKKKIAE